MGEEWPVATFIIITINLAVFLFSYDILTNQVSEEVIYTFGLSPDQVYLRPYIIITHMFVHADIIHFLGNMLMLAIVGLVTETKIGTLKFVLFYFFCGLVAVPFDFLMEFLIGTTFTSVGASGAIFGVMFLAAAIAGGEEVPALLIPILNVIAIPYILLTLKNIKVPLYIAIVFYFLLNLLMMFYNLPYSIGEVAHLGGIFGGIIGISLFTGRVKTTF